MAPPPPAPPPWMMEEVVEEILLRLPPGDPALLVHAALVCKQWCRLVSGTGFRRRFRWFHRTGPVLGVLCNLWHGRSYTARFVRTSSSSCPRYTEDRRSFALDARHGRVLLSTRPPRDARGLLAPLAPGDLIVWDPVTDERRQLPAPRCGWGATTWNTAVLCASAAGACDHLDCHGRAFRVVFVTLFVEAVHVHVYSSEAGAWSTPTVGHRLLSISDSDFTMMRLGPSLLVGGSLHFALEYGGRILTYDLGGRSLSVITMPQSLHRVGITGLVTAEDGGLGVAAVEKHHLHLWSWRVGHGGWNKGRAINMTFHIDIGLPTAQLHVVGFAEGSDTIFVTGYDGLFAVALKSGHVQKVLLEGRDFWGIVPYVSFYTPDQARGLSHAASHQ